MKHMWRRTFLTSSGLTTLGALAGCSAPNSEAQADETETTASATTTAQTTASSDSESPPGADQLGGPDDLQSAPTVEVVTLDSDAGAGQFVFTPAVVWVVSGATVAWEWTSGSHSVTSYHPDNADHSLRVPSETSAFDSGVESAEATFEHTFETPGVYNYYCTPHEGLGMVGLVIVEGPNGGPGTTSPEDVQSGSAKESLSGLLRLAEIEAGSENQSSAYSWQDATWDSYWYSLYNMSTNIAMSGNGVRFPHNEAQRDAFEKRVPAMLEHADVDKPPIKNPHLNMAAFTKGDPHFTQQPVLQGEDGRPDAATLRWDSQKSSKIVSPSSLAWTHLKGVTWAKNFQNHFDILPPEIAAKFRAQMLTTLAQIGVNAALIAGGPEENGALTKGESLELVSGFRPSDGVVVDETSRPHHHSSMLWFLSDLNSLAQNGWFGYVNPEPLIPAPKIQQLTDGVAKTTMELFTPADIVDMRSSRDLGEMLAAFGWYGTHAGSTDIRGQAARYANELAAEVEANLSSNGMVENGTENQAATQGAIGQGLVWASQLDDVDHTDLASDVIGYLLDTLWDGDAGTFASSEGASTYTMTARDVGDVTGGLNAADAELGTDRLKEIYAQYFNQTFNRGRLQRAERPQSRNESAEFSLPLPPNAGGQHGQAAVYNTEVEYDTATDEWTVTDSMFDTEGALYLSNQDIWISQWGGDFYQSRGVPGKSDTPL